VVGLLAYDFGLRRAGYLRSVSMAEREALTNEVATLRGDNKQLSERIAVLETAAKVDREAYRQVEAELVELQARILEQQEDIEFYRGIVGEDDGSQLRIQDFRVVSAATPGDYQLRLVLAQALRSSREIAGRIDVAFEGARDGRPETLDMAELTDESVPIGYEFRYFQEIRAGFRLPNGFRPERVRVRIRPGSGRGKSAETVEEVFVWAVETG
jgi:hypothetical protein